MQYINLTKIFNFVIYYLYFIRLFVLIILNELTINEISMKYVYENSIYLYCYNYVHKMVTIF
jgi:hypothetical protein